MPVPALQPRGSDTVASVLSGHAARTPTAPFLLFERSPGDIERFTYAEFDRLVAQTAGALARHGAGQGDRISVHLGNCPEFYEVWFAAARLGATIVPSNPLSTADELSYMIEHAGCRLAITQTDLRAVVDKAGASTVVDVCEPWVRPGDHAELADVRSTDPLGILYTSGTTSRPKGVVITHSAYLHVGDMVADHLRLRPDDRQLVVLPLFHGNAQYYSTMSALVTGASIALTPKFSASRWPEQANELGATVASLFAAPIRMILAQPPTPHDGAHRLRVAMFAQNITDDQLATFEQRFSVPLVQLYGMTETVVPPTMNPLYEERRGTSIGRPLPGAKVRIVGTDGSDVPAGESGELVVYGEPGVTIMAEYLANSDATADTLRDGWLHTGDTVSSDPEGYLYFVDRRKDLIKRAGENVASTEVERVINEHPAVFESAVVGVPDEMRDEAIVAYVVLHEGASASPEELVEHCRGQLASFKVPSAVELVADLPRTSVGKVQKHLLRRPAGEGHQPAG